MANTTNFGWETPDDTDLVKDGAAAIRTLAGAIDTSLVDLKGGTTGQVLAKNSNTDMDFVWSADASGIPATIFDAKGDLIVASAADTAARLAVGGTNGHVLTVNSSATNGIEWAAVSSSPTFVGCRIYKAGETNQTIANNTTTAVTFDAEDFDTDAFHDNSTNNSRITIPSGKGGKYLFTASGHWDENATGDRQMYLRKNGNVANILSYQRWSSDGYVGVTFASVFSLVATDYIELIVFQNSGGNLVLLGSSTNLQATFLGA